jgi:hypothetical protein
MIMSLKRRRTIEVDLPESLVRSLHRVAESNVNAGPDEQVDINDVIEWYLAAPITVQDVIPGFSDALRAWLATVSYDRSRYLGEWAAGAG